MRDITVELGRNSYPIWVGSDLLLKTGNWLGEHFSGKLVIITDPTVKKLYGDILSHALTDEGFQVTTRLVPEGEEQKSLENAARLYQELSDSYAERTTPIVALGGGVIGDLAGFVAATYLRGVPFIQMPTTLLAQVDASIGGKVAVDHGRLKNKIGAFYQPRLVVADIDTLKSLPQPELANGVAEVIKSAAIRNKEFFAFLEGNLDKVKALDEKVLEETVFQTARIKAAIVAKDERETGLRSLLNYGHTIGHAVESVLGFQMEHGRAIAIGMVAAARISNRMGLLNQRDMARLADLVKKAGLPTEMPEVKVDKMLELMKHDKKVLQDRIRFVLLKSIGDAFITDEVDIALVREVLSGE